MISMEKKYKTRLGNDVRVLCVDAGGNYSVIVLVNNEVYRCTKNGIYIEGKQSNCDLIEVSPYEDFKKDDPVMVRAYVTDNCWVMCYFSHVEDGSPFSFISGATSWSSGGHTTRWLECRRPTAEELAGVK